MTMKVFGMVAAAVLWTGQAMAKEDVIIHQWPTGTKNNASATMLVDSDVNLNRDQATAQGGGHALRTGVTDLRLTTGDTTTGFTLGAADRTATLVIDSSTPIKKVIVWCIPTTVTQFSESVAGWGSIGFSIYGKTAANLRQGYMPVKPFVPLVIEGIQWYNTTGTSVSMFAESTIAGLAFSVQVIR